MTPAITSIDARLLAPLMAYIKGHETGDCVHTREAFLVTARIEGMRDGTFITWTLDEYCRLFTGRPAEDEALRRRTIDWVRSEGDTGCAQLTLTHGPTTFSDFLLLVKVAEAWKIAAKVYCARASK